MRFANDDEHPPRICREVQSTRAALYELPNGACVGRGNIAHFSLNIAAALDKKKLTKAQLDTFKKYALQNY